MKLKIILITVILMSFSAFAKDINVPQAVKDAFAKLYPKVTETKWEMEARNQYEAEFKENGQEVTVIFNKNGVLLATETTIKLSELPKNIEKTVNKKFSGYKMLEASKIVDNKGKITYEVDIAQGNNKKELLFKANGSLIKVNPTEDEENDED